MKFSASWVTCLLTYNQKHIRLIPSQKKEEKEKAKEEEQEKEEGEAEAENEEDVKEEKNNITIKEENKKKRFDWFVFYRLSTLCRLFKAKNVFRF